jgi:diguanylate cyclase (GGDEF)-like protein
VAHEPINTSTGGGLAITVSIGVAGRGCAPTAESLLAAADAALYRAKSAGRNQVVYAEPDGGR